MTTKTNKSARIYSYTTETNGSWITRQAKKAGMTKANFIHSIVDDARKNKFTVNTTVKKAAKKVK
jgi:hypothetical protein